MKKYLLSLIVAAVAAGAMAFTTVKAPVEEGLAVQYQFEGSSMDDVYDTELWSEITGTAPSCVEGDLPCVVEVQSGSIGDWLNARNEQQILNDAKTRKP